MSVTIAWGISTMIVNSFQISNELQLTPLAPERAAQAVQSKDARIWLDVQTAEPAGSIRLLGVPAYASLQAGS